MTCWIPIIQHLMNSAWGRHRRIRSPEGNIGISVCLEILYPGYVRRSVKEGAYFLVNISNDSWFGNSAMPYFHLNAPRLRAVENRSFLLRTSNSGIPAVIYPTGKIQVQSGLFTKERVGGRFVKLDQVSFYARYGNLVLFAAACILFVALLEMIFNKDVG